MSAAGAAHLQLPMFIIQAQAAAVGNFPGLLPELQVRNMLRLRVHLSAERFQALPTLAQLSLQVLSHLPLLLKLMVDLLQCKLYSRENGRSVTL